MPDRSTLTLDQLERHLYGCADKIRNAVDKTDYKDFILPLVFYKTISDTFEDKVEELTEEYGDEEVARHASFHAFVIPDDYGWDDLRSQGEGIDVFINDALNAIEDANPEKLNGVFRADYIREDALDDDRLGALVEHLSTHNLSMKRLPPDMLGEAYMDLVRHFADEEGRDGGEFFTPPGIVRLMVRLVAPFRDGDRFHDPTCGSAGMLIEAARHFREEQGGDPERLTLTGQEVNPDIAAIAKMNLFIHGYNGKIERQESLRRPQFTNGDGQLETFDYVLANFPFSADWAKGKLGDDVFGRFSWAEKLPRADRGDYAFIMHMAKQLSERGTAAIVIPHGVLFRKHERRYRQPMIERDLVEAVVGLPANLFQNNSIPSALLLLNKAKPEERRGQVQFIHAADEAFYRDLGSSQNELTPEGIDHVVRNFHDFATEERVSRVVEQSEIAENDFNLNIALYVDTTEPEEPIDVREELAELRRLQTERDATEAQLNEYLEALGYDEKRAGKETAPAA